MKIAIDIDGTICKEKPAFEKVLTEPFPEALEKINKMKDDGHQIIFFTARGWNEYNVTKYWLDKHGFKYDLLLCGKPSYDYIIDDRSLQPKWDSINL